MAQAEITNRAISAEAEARALAFLQDYVDMYEDARECGEYDTYKKYYSKFVTATMLLEEMTGLEVTFRGGRLVLEEAE